MNKKSVTILGISIWKLFAYFIIYSFIGYVIETLFGIATKGVWESRQSFLYGPFCGIYGIGAITITLLSRYFNKNKLTLFVGGFLVGSVTEYTISFLVDTILHTKWWDYSNMPLNLNGYVCLLFSLIWGVFCVFIVDVFHPLIDTLLSHIPFLVGIILVCILVIAGLADLYVTASGILKLNKRLEKMQAIADELHQISDKLGESIYKRTITAMEKQEEFKDTVSEKQEEFKSAISEKQEAISDTLADVSDEVKERIALLRRSYLENVKATSHMQKRIMKAFPKMQSRNYKESFEDLRNKLKEMSLKK